MNPTSKSNRKQAKANNTSINILQKEDLRRKIVDLERTMKASTWRELETSGKFAKNDKLTFITEDMLILGCDVGSETHYIRAIDVRGRELSKKAFSFSNNEEGFSNAKEWAMELAAANNKKQIVMGLEPTGHYWFCLAAWMIANNISVVQVNPYAVKQTKELEDNSQLKDDRKDPKLIANLVKDGNYGMPYLPERLYAELRQLALFRDQMQEDRTRYVNRLHRLLKIHFPEYKDAFVKVDGVFAMELLKKAPFPEDLKKLGEDGIKQIWHSAKLRGRGYGRAAEIMKYAQSSVGLTEGIGSNRTSVKFFVTLIAELDVQMAEIESLIEQKCLEIPHAEKILEISGMGMKILSGIISEIGDISRFDDVKELQKLSGLGLVACSSGKHKGETKISHRGRKRMRYWLFQAGQSVVAHSAEFRSLHEYYTTREVNPLKKMQSLIAVACKVLRVIYAILKTGCRYDPQKLLKDIRRPMAMKEQAA